MLNIKCDEDHLVHMTDEYGRTPLKNCVLELIRNDLNLDFYYIATHRMILIRVDKDTIKIPEYA